MKLRTALTAVAAAGALAAAPLVARAQEAPTAPAPPSEAEAYAAQLQLGGEQVAAVGHTQAQAGSDAGASSAHAGAVELGPEPPPAEQFGGTQEGAGASSGAFIETDDTGFEQLGRIAVTPWEAAVSEDGSGRHSHAKASLLELLLAPGGTRILQVSVFVSESSADHTDALSKSRASTDGVVVILGDPSTDQSLTLRILHSEASSESGASTYVISIADNKIASNEDELGGGLAQICSAINIPGLLKLLCVQASGGAAQVLGAVLGDGGAQGGLVDLLRVQQAGGAGAEPAPVAPAPEVMGITEVAPEAPAEAEVAGASLPRTGAGVMGFAAGLLVLLGALQIAMVQRRARLAAA